MFTKTPFYANPVAQDFIDRKPLPELKSRIEMTQVQVDRFLASEEPKIQSFRRFELKPTPLQSASGDGDCSRGRMLCAWDTPYTPYNGYWWQVHEMSARRWDSQSIDRLDAINKGEREDHPEVRMEITHVDRLNHTGYILRSW